MKSNSFQLGNSFGENTIQCITYPLDVKYENQLNHNQDRQHRREKGSDPEKKTTTFETQLQYYSLHV